MASLLASDIALSIALIVALGVFAQWVAWRMNLPAILPLLITGFLVGPVLGWIVPTQIVPENLLFPSISLAVGLILFEGGLTLRIPEIRETRQVVLNLNTIGALVTFLGGAAAAYFLTDLSLPLSFLFGSLIIVTGPTVIGPLVRIVRPEARVANILKWEGIIIDAVGALVAVLVFEFLLIDNRNVALGQTILLFLQFILFGTLIGAAGGLGLSWLLKRRAIPDFLVNVIALGGLFLVFAIANSFANESGLLATIVMGIIVGNSGAPNIRSMLSFKEDLTILVISILFIVLAANIELAAFLDVLRPSSLVLLAVIMLLLRPAGVFLSTITSPLRLNEKLFLSFIAPRGIVAASVSSLFAARLASNGFPEAQQLVSLVFLVIVGTVLINSLTARPLGQLLKVADPNPQGFLVLGAHEAARKVASFLKESGQQVLLADTNWSNVARARNEGLPAYYGSLLSERSDDEVRLSGIGRLLALTSNDEANAMTALKYARDFGSTNTYQLKPSRQASERNRLSDQRRGLIVFKRGITFRQLGRLMDKGAQFVTTPVGEGFRFDSIGEEYGPEALPMFIRNGNRLKVLVEGDESPVPEEGDEIISLVPTAVAPGDADSTQATAAAGS